MAGMYIRGRGGRRFRKGPKMLRRAVRKSSQFYGKRIKQPVQFFQRTQYLPGFYNLIAGGAGTGAAVNFKLSSVPNAAEFTQLYDQYQIKGIKISLIPRFTEVPNSSGTGNMWSILDYDDSNVPANLDTLLQYQNVKRTRMHMVHSRYLKPQVTSEVYATGIATAYAPKKNVWLDVGNPDVEHYGVKLWFDSRLTNVIFDVQIKYYLAFKNVR